MAKAYRPYGNSRARGSYRYTASRRAALRKAQIASARKRKRNAKIKKVAGLGAVAAGGIAAGVVLGKTEHGKNIKASVKAAGMFANDLGAAFKAVEPHKKEQTRRQRAISRKRREKDRAFEATRKNGDRQTVKPLTKGERKDLMAEANKKPGPNALDSNTFNKDGTITKSAIVGTALTDKEIRAGIARNSRKRAQNGGQGLTRAEKNKIFKTLKQNQAMNAGRPTNQTISGLRPRMNLARTYDPMANLHRSRFNDEKLLRSYNRGR